METVPAAAKRADQSTSATLHSVFIGNFKATLRNRDIHRFRASNPNGDISFIQFLSEQRSDFKEFQMLRPKEGKVRPSVATDKVRVGYFAEDGRYIRSQFEDSPWRGEKPVFFSMHGNGFVGQFSLQRPAHERNKYPDGHLTVTVDGTTAADMLWETRSFQHAISKDPHRPLVGVICDAAGPSAVFSDGFCARMFDNGFKAPIYLPTGKAGATFTSDWDKTGAEEYIPFYEQTIGGPDPIAVFQPPSK